MSKRIDLKHMKFNHLIAIRFNGQIKGRTYWIFKCDCGLEKSLLRESVQRGYTTSCGCMHGKKKLIPREERICACGCGDKFSVRPTDAQKWINGHWMKGQKRSEEVRKKLSQQKMGDKNPMYREGHYNWKGGISFVPYPLGWSRTFKEQIRYRDGYRCQDCGIPESELGQRLDVHHIDENKFNLDHSNLVCLCRSCHSSRHTNIKKSLVTK